MPAMKEKNPVQHSFHGPRPQASSVAELSQGQGVVTETVAYFKCFTLNKSIPLKGKKKIQCTIIALTIR